MLTVLILFVAAGAAIGAAYLGDLWAALPKRNADFEWLDV